MPPRSPYATRDYTKKALGKFWDRLTASLASDLKAFKLDIERRFTDIAAERSDARAAASALDAERKEVAKLRNEIAALKTQPREVAKLEGKLAKQIEILEEKQIETLGLLDDTNETVNLSAKLLSKLLNKHDELKRAYYNVQKENVGLRDRLTKQERSMKSLRKDVRMLEKQAGAARQPVRTLFRTPASKPDVIVTEALNGTTQTRQVTPTTFPKTEKPNIATTKQDKTPKGSRMQRMLDRFNVKGGKVSCNSCQ